ncbi:hypothetical protein FQN54_001903 [Arachnomyces sp. PD_36]|nr:hypothetical protein FQN54_001903 [Arachnomyces sp. PD_36]
MVSFETEYINVGGNRHPAAADWNLHSGLLAYGADNNVALWDPTDKSGRGVYALLVSHTDKVNAVKFHTHPSTGSCLLTGSIDRTIRVWQPSPASSRSFTHVSTLQGHDGSINSIAAVDNSDIIASGAADGTVRIWKLLNDGGGVRGDLQETIVMKPRFFPLALALRVLDSESPSKPMILAVGGTKSIVQIYVAQDTTGVPNFRLCATLTGHEGWIRSLSFVEDGKAQNGDLLLASASQDKYIRLWRVHPGDDNGVVRPAPDNKDSVLSSVEETLSNKIHRFDVCGSRHSVTFEALLFGHEDWIYTTAWNPDPKRTQLLSASADNSLAIWEPDVVSGVWFPTSRMGEISAQKGSTSATGSTGGFWIGLWSPDGGEVVSLGRTGSWRSWKYDEDSAFWVQRAAITGHIKSVNGIRWESGGGYLLSTSSDQTTRLHAKWKHGGLQSWHELSRPQIHGYDLNCIDSLGSHRFVSGADEKLLRVFDEPRAIADMLERFCGLTSSKEELPDSANMPVLGLSNKAMDDEVQLGEEEQDGSEAQPTGQVQTPLLDLDQPPFEDHLARHTLWPEHEKLYGHGYEISALAATKDRSLVATACKASSIDHAVIRLYDTGDWHEIKPSLVTHSLTITSLSFSSDDQLLLSVGRDRQWAIFQRGKQDMKSYSLLQSNPKGHSRMILDAAWAPTENRIFATAGRDKTVKLWGQEEGQFVCKTTISVSRPVTAIDILPTVIEGHICLAIGEDDGQISFRGVAVNGMEASDSRASSIPKLECPSKAITQLSWRPLLDREQDGYVNGAASNKTFEVAVASEDSSVRIYTIDNLLV